MLFISVTPLVNIVNIKISICMCIKETIEKFQIEKHKHDYNMPTTLQSYAYQLSTFTGLDWTRLMDPL